MNLDNSKRGLTITLRDCKEPIVLSFQNKQIQVRLSKKASANCHTINISAPREVDILMPHTKKLLEEKIALLEEENKKLKLEAGYKEEV